MIFSWEGEQYDTAQMKGFETDKPGILRIFLTQDNHHVFVLTMNKWTGASVHRANADEIKRLSQSYGIAEILQALPYA